MKLKTKKANKYLEAPAFPKTTCLCKVFDTTPIVARLSTEINLDSPEDNLICLFIDLLID